MLIRPVLCRSFRLVLPAALIVLFALGCVEPYATPDLEFNDEILVVDGYLDLASNSATVTLSRAIALNSSSTFPVESFATVRIVSESGASIDVPEVLPGKYSFSGVPLSSTEKYQLYIVRQNGKEYRSDYIETKESPPIDSVTWKPEPNGISISVSTHDSQANTRYYQWTFQETWEYNARFFSTYKLVDGIAIPRSTDEYVYQCWKTQGSQNVLINSTTRLTDDIVADFPLIFIERGDVKLARTYSLLVQQRALTREAYEFWSELKKTTESLGGLFDPLPWQLTGNVYSVNNSAEPVLGYFSGGSAKEARIFIRFNDLPDDLRELPVSFCVLDSIPLNELANYPNSTYLISGYGIRLEGYTAAPIGCADCRYFGGVTEKPPFMP